jgi:hypothetical protein
MDFSIEYYGIGWQEERMTHTGTMDSLAECIDWLEGSGAQAVTVTDIDLDQVVYQDGGYVVREFSVVTGDCST